MKTWNVVAKEILVHSWEVDAETEEEANEIALEGCPMPDGDCSSQHFDIVSVKDANAKQYSLEVFADDQWRTALTGLSHAEALSEATAFTRFRIVEEVKIS